MGWRWIELLYALLEVLLALLAGFGLYALGRMWSGGLLRAGQKGGRVYAVIPAEGDGGGLEMAVKELLWLRAGEGGPCTLVIADRGLNGSGRAVAEALAEAGDSVVLCRPEELPEFCV